ncbi:MAG: universal stress protein [Streptosporangiaceae bacterium]
MTGVIDGILAGYDGSPGSAQAVRWAAREARARGTTLDVCVAWTPDHIGPPTEAAICELARQHGKEILSRGLPYAESALAPGQVRPVLASGSAARVLCERSRTAEMVVVGARGHSELRGLRIGSVARQVAGFACGRVVVVRGPWRPANQSPGPIVAGVDGSPSSLAALRFAFEEAGLRAVPLVAVCALADAPGRLGESDLIAGEFGRAMDRLEQDHPEITIARHVVAGSPRAAMLAMAADAQLLVVGGRGRGGFRGMRLGSLAQAVLDHTPCPVGVVHSSRTLSFRADR